MNENIEKEFDKSIELIRNSKILSTQISQSIDYIVNCLKTGNKIIIFGNGGSAADAQHIAAELIGRFKLERKSYPAIALSTDSSIITSLANDYSFDIIFSRQCESLVLKNDVIIGISTSGNSENVRKGILAAKKLGAKTIGLLGNDGGIIANEVDLPITVPSSTTSKIQEAHRIIYHIICEFVEKKLSEKQEND
jgi:D-sedoheptulose 7-phosphate isomerase